MAVSLADALSVMEREARERSNLFNPYTVR